MSVKTTAMPLCNSASTCLLLVLFLISYISICSGILKESVRVSRDENTAYPETTIPQGTLRGINMVTHYNRTVFGFIGIPYAQPPVGNLRFKAAVPPDVWNGTFDAISDTEHCLQITDEREMAGDEDCLHLNVFTPKLPASDNSSTLLPVMMYIIGGGFKKEDNAIFRFGPEFLLDEDVVMVYPNFRVGVLGFLSTGDEASPGNYGLKDIVRALEWVQDSIRYFGGDPNQVTLFGGSSGAMSTHLLALSDLTDGLIHRYITQSGSAFSYNAYHPREACAKRAIRLGEHFGCPTDTSTLLVNCLRDLNASQLIDTDSLFYVWGSDPYNVWVPTTEPDIEGALLTDTPANLYAAGKIRDLPWLASLTRDEGFITAAKFYEDADLFEDFLEDIDFILPYMLDYYDVVDDPEAHTTALKYYYLNDLTANRNILLENFTQLAGDAMFAYPVYNALQQQLVLAENPQYLCSLQYRGTFSLGYLFSGGSTAYPQVSHGDEIVYLFGHQDHFFGPSDAEFSEADWFMVKTMVQLWTSFATNGIPTTRDSVSTTTWEPYSTLNNYLRIGNQSDTALEMQYDLMLERMQFWDRLTKSTTTSGGFCNPLECESGNKGQRRSALQDVTAEETENPRCLDEKV